MTTSVPPSGDSSFVQELLAYRYRNLLSERLAGRIVSETVLVSLFFALLLVEPVHRFAGLLSILFIAALASGSLLYDRRVTLAIRQIEQHVASLLDREEPLLKLYIEWRHSSATHPLLASSHSGVILAIAIIDLLLVFT